MKQKSVNNFVNKTEKKSRRISVDVYLPNNLDLDSLIKQYPLTIFREKKDKTEEPIHIDINAIKWCISTVCFFSSVTDQQDGNPNISSTNFRKHCMKTYAQHLEWCERAGIFEIGNSYKRGSHAKKYKLNPVYDTMVVKDKANFNTPNRSDTEADDHDQWLNTYYSGLTLDRTEANNKIEQYERDIASINTDLYTHVLTDAEERTARLERNRLIRKRNHLFIYADRFDSIKMNGKRNNTNYRHESVVSHSPSEIRHGIHYMKQDLVSVDLKNSQLFFLCVVIRDMIHNHTSLFSPYCGSVPKKPSNTVNIQQLGFYSVPLTLRNHLKIGEDFQVFESACIDGSLYETVGKMYTEMYGIERERDWSKQNVFMWLFDVNKQQNDRSSIDKVFRKNFPAVHTIVQMFKEHENRTLSIILQRIESYFVLDMIAKTLMVATRIPFFTLHDSIVTLEQHVNTVSTLIKSVIIEATGIAPQIDLQQWNGENQ